MSRTIEQIGADIHTQDNLATALPVFIVQQVERIYGLEGDDCQYVWLNPEQDYRHADKDESERFERRFQARGEIPNHWIRAGYIERWDFVTACFTRVGCEDYIRVNGHNLKSPRIYVASGYRNKEWEAVRAHLMSKDPNSKVPEQVTA